jgi:hypothetical protein
MPSLNIIKILGNMKFLSHNLKLPVDWQAPTGDVGSKQYGDSIKPSEKVAAPQLNPPWFLPAEGHKYFQDSCDKVGQEFKELHDTMLDAVKFGHEQWQLQAQFQNLQVAAAMAIGSPGCLNGPDLEQLIKMYPDIQSWSGNKAKYRDAIAKGVSTCFKNWQQMVTCPALPLFPLFAAFALAMAPPTPNMVPMPLIAFVSGMIAQIAMPDQMKQEMINAFDGDLKQKDKGKHHEALFDAIATVLSLAFLMWMPQQMVQNLMATGPVPSWTPFSPVGPVVGGMSIPGPGHTL